MNVDYWQVLIAVVSAVVYSAVWYGRARQQGEPFKPKKFGATLLVGAGIGLSAGLLGTNVSFPTIQAQLAGYMGLIAVLEGLLKMCWEFLWEDVEPEG